MGISVFAKPVANNFRKKTENYEPEFEIAFYSQNSEMAKFQKRVPLILTLFRT